MSSFLKNICFVFYLQIALTNTVLADKKLDQYLVDITPLLNKSKSVIFFDAKKKSLTTIKGAESNTYIKHYKKLFQNQNTSCIIILSSNNFGFTSKTSFIWGNDLSILTHQGDRIKASITDVLKNIEMLKIELRTNK